MATGQVGELSVALHFDGKGLKTSMSKVEKEATSSTTKIGTVVGRGFANKFTVAAGNLISSGISKVMSSVTSNMDAAISRADTLNNFSNVMGNLGINAEQSQASIEKMADKLTGLPTSLDAGAAAVQRFTSKNGDIAESTDMFLSLNNALLAGGAPAELQATALEQISQAYAKGKPDMAEWRSLANAMPAQLKQVADAMGYVDADALGEDLRSGKLSMDDFMGTIQRLNKEGTNGLKSFEDQAFVATGGIRTQLTNLSASMTRILTDALNGEDMSKSAAQFVERFTEIIPRMVTAVTNAASSIVALIPQLLPPVLQAIMDAAPAVLDAIVTIIDSLAPLLPDIIDTLFNFILDIGMKIIDRLPEILLKIVNGLMSIVNLITRPENLNKLLTAAIKLFLVLVKAVPQVIVALVNALPQIIDNVISFLTNPETLGMLIGAAVELWMSLALAVPQILGALFGAFGTLLGNLWEGIKTMFGAFAANFGSFITSIFKNAINGVLTFIENFINGPIDILNGFIDVINDAFGGIGVNLGRISRINLPRLAQGGIATGATTAIIGEAGREVVLPLEHNTGNWSGLLASALATEFDERDGSPTGGVVIEKMEFKINNELDAREIGRVMMESIRRAA